MSAAKKKRARTGATYTAQEWEFLNDFAAFLVHCDLRDLRAAAEASEEPVTDGKHKTVDT